MLLTRNSLQMKRPWVNCTCFACWLHFSTSTGEKRKEVVGPGGSKSSYPPAVAKRKFPFLVKALGEQSRDPHPPEERHQCPCTRSSRLPGPDGSSTPNLRAVQSQQQPCILSNSALVFKYIYNHGYYPLHKHTLSCQAVRANPPTKLQQWFLQMWIKLNIICTCVSYV